MRAAVVKDATVINVIEVDDLSFPVGDGETLVPTETGGIGDAYANDAFSHTSDMPEVTADSVVAERTRRLALGFDYDFGDSRGVHHIGTSPVNMVGWDEVSKLASALLFTDNGTQQIPIATDTGQTYVTPLEWQAVLIASAQFRQPLWTASFVLMASDPIPSDFASDSYWE